MIRNEDIYRVFISHAWNYRNEYYRLEKMLDETSGFRWQNIFPGFATPRRDPDERLEGVLRTQIEACDAVLVISDLFHGNERWIETEMEIARELDKPIIGISPRNGDEAPWDIRKVASDMVEWSGDELTDAIRRHTSRTALHETATARPSELSWGSP